MFSKDHTIFLLLLLNILEEIMRKIKCLLIVLVITVFTFNIYAKAPVVSGNESVQRPRRIIRTCCSFGTEMQLFAIPGVKLTEITGLDKIGSHHYMGDSSEENGIIYSRRGGFIDMGHLRDQIDWMAFLYNQLNENKQNGKLLLELGHEGGQKNLNVLLPDNLSNTDLILLSGKIVYDLSVWHEIATWFGASTIPFVPERYSSFSIEDAYSNLLGVTIGIQAIQSELPYEEAVTGLIAQTLKNMDAVTNEIDTYMAMEAVRDIWWTREKRLPSSKVLLKRQIQVYPCLQPWLVPGWASLNKESNELKIPEYASTGKTLNSLYQLEFKLNYKFPFKKMFPDRKERTITQNDFNRLLVEVTSELQKKESRAENQKSD